VDKNCVSFVVNHSGGQINMSTQTQLVEQAAQVIVQANQSYSRLVFANSLGAEDMVLSHLLAKHSPQTHWFTLQTGRLHAQTVQLIVDCEAFFKIPIGRFEPLGLSVVQFTRKHGEFPMYESVDLRKQCCQLRKLEPLQRALGDSQAWFTGLRREQSEYRQQVVFSEQEASGRFKLSPLAQWSTDAIWQYIKEHQLPYNPLHDQGYPSIGCEPCTRAIRAGEAERAGRWWWEQGHQECGLHLKETT
jgi:phosphoadenosine phosphosulfate reductase